MSDNIETIANNEQEVQTNEPEFKWYVVHTYSGHEEKVVKQLENKIANSDLCKTVSKAYVHKIKDIVVKNGKEETKERIAFPGYVFVKMVYTKESWYQVRNVNGVTGFVGPDPMTPTPLPASELRAMGLEVDFVPEPEYVSAFSVGEKICVISGPLSGNEGTVEAVIPQKGCIKATVSMFGRKISAELEYSQVEKAE